MNIVIVGISGFLGSRLKSFFQKKRYKVFDYKKKLPTKIDIIINVAGPDSKFCSENIKRGISERLKINNRILKIVKKNKIKHTYSETNIGLCSAVNHAVEISTTDYIMYTHDDMFFCKNWDLYLENIVKLQKNNLFYLSGKTISNNDTNDDFRCGLTPDVFNQSVFENYCIK